MRDRRLVEPRVCTANGVPGWTSVSASVTFSADGGTAAEVYNAVAKAMAAQGWKAQSHSPDYVSSWWRKTISRAREATASLSWTRVDWILAAQTAPVGPASQCI